MASLLGLPDELLLHIVAHVPDHTKTWLSLCQTSRRLKPIGEERLYQNARVRRPTEMLYSESGVEPEPGKKLPEWVGGTVYLLRTLLERPKLAQKVVMLDISAVSGQIGSHWLRISPNFDLRELRDDALHTVNQFKTMAANSSSLGGFSDGLALEINSCKETGFAGVILGLVPNLAELKIETGCVDPGQVLFGSNTAPLPPVRACFDQLTALTIPDRESRLLKHTFPSMLRLELVDVACHEHDHNTYWDVGQQPALEYLALHLLPDPHRRKISMGLVSDLLNRINTSHWTRVDISTTGWRTQAGSSHYEIALPALEHTARTIEEINLLLPFTENIFMDGSFLHFPNLRKLSIPYGLWDYWAAFPPILEPEKVFPRSLQVLNIYWPYKGFERFLGRLILIRHLFPSLSEMSVYYGGMSDDYGAEAWQELADLGVSVYVYEARDNGDESWKLVEWKRFEAER